MKRWLAIIAVALCLVGCGSGGDGEEELPVVGVSDPWPIQIPIEVEDYVHVMVTINGTSLRCIFDTGAPGVWLPPDMLEAESITMAMGNYERTNVSAYELSPEHDWTGCLFGLPFFVGMTEFDLNLETDFLMVR